MRTAMTALPLSPAGERNHSVGGVVEEGLGWVVVVRGVCCSPLTSQLSTRARQLPPLCAQVLKLETLVTCSTQRHAS